MKWLSVNTGSLNENFELWDDERKLAEISFTKGTRIARFVSSISRRIEPKAFPRNDHYQCPCFLQQTRFYQGFGQFHQKTFGRI